MGARARARESSGAQLLIIKPSFPSLLPLAAPLLSRGPRPRPRPARSPHHRQLKAMWEKRTPLIALSKTPRFSSPIGLPPHAGACACSCSSGCAGARELRLRGRRRRGRQEFPPTCGALQALCKASALQTAACKQQAPAGLAGRPARPEA